MAFPIESVAKEYIDKRFPRASAPEKQKYVQDWTAKIRDSRALVEDFTRRVGSPQGKKILDSGVGNGGVSIAFSMAGADVHGVEIETDLYEIAKRHASSLGVTPRFYLYDGRVLPFADGTFDYAVSVSVLEHTDDPTLYLKEILRVMKPSGCLYLGFPNKYAPRETHTGLLFLTYLPAFLRPLYIRALRRNPLEDNNLHFYGYADLSAMLRQIKDSENKYCWNILEEKGVSQSAFKKAAKKLLGLFGIPYKAVLPHVLVILKKQPK